MCVFLVQGNIHLLCFTVFQKQLQAEIPLCEGKKNYFIARRQFLKGVIPGYIALYLFVSLKILFLLLK